MAVVKGNSNNSALSGLRLDAIAYVIGFHPMRLYIALSGLFSPARTLYKRMLWYDGFYFTRYIALSGLRLDAISYVIGFHPMRLDIALSGLFSPERTMYKRKEVFHPMNKNPERVL